jgi:hypothetical protein
MSTHSIEPGQRLQTKSGEASAVVEVISEAVVPCGYWLCRDEASGHRRLIARTALFPVASDVTIATTSATIFR